MGPVAATQASRRGKTDPTGRARVSATQEGEARGRAGALIGPGEKVGPRLGLRERRKEKGRAEIAGLKTFSFFFSQNQTNKFNSNSNSKI